MFSCQKNVRNALTLKKSEMGEAGSKQMVWAWRGERVIFAEKVSIWGVVFTLYGLFSLLSFLHLGETQLIFAFQFLFWTACFVVDCGGGLAYDVINTIGQAFEIRFKMFYRTLHLPLKSPKGEDITMNWNLSTFDHYIYINSISLRWMDFRKRSTLRGA